MARSKRKTTLAVLRGILGPVHGQERHFARLAGRSVSWVKKASAGIVPLSEGTARVLETETGVSFQWLLGAATRPPISHGLAAEPYTHEYFDWYRSEMKSGSPITQSAFSLLDFLPELLSAGFAAAGSRKAALFMWRLKFFIAELTEEFGCDDRAAEITKHLLLQKKGYAPLEQGGDLRLTDLWIVDKDRRGRLRFKLGTPAAELIATDGPKAIRLKSTKLPSGARSLTSQRVLASEKRPVKK